MDQVSYVISDLHLGGAPSTGAGDPGFRMCYQVDRLAEFISNLSTGPRCELVINGDFVDFLAERSSDGSWQPATPDPAEAAKKLRTIAEERPDGVVFAALNRFLANGHRLVLLVGNHDIELGFREVRVALRDVLTEGRACDLEMILDGEAYSIGNTLIEHGNRYDSFNVVDHDRLRELRSLSSRRQAPLAELPFLPPVGSQLVASIMNPYKKRYPFIDLLKPEDEAVVPILLALEPDAKGRILDILRFQWAASRHQSRSPAMPRRRGEIASATESFEAPLSAEEALFAAALSSNDVPESLEPAARTRRRSIASDRGETTPRLDWHSGIAELLLRGSDYKSRLRPLLRALRTLRFETSFDIHTDPSVYPRHAAKLASGGFGCVIFGHTHLAKDIAISPGVKYLNTGTWVDLIKLPAGLFVANEEDACRTLDTFIQQLLHAPRDEWVLRRSTFARVVVSENRTEATLHEYGGSIP
jgi:UDP-2,3-diacylglucosamine pyrophosphatase LpxH